MLVWINGAFGVGKTTTAEQFVKRAPGYRLFDPEHVGYMLMANLRGIEIADFQDLVAWRALVPVVARYITESTGQDLVAVQTVLNLDYWSELRAGLESQGITVMHVLLDVEPDVLRLRITDDRQEQAAQAWRLGHVETFCEARSGLRDMADLVVDTTARRADEAAERVALALL